MGSLPARIPDGESAAPLTAACTPAGRRPREGRSAGRGPCHHGSSMPPGVLSPPADGRSGAAAAARLLGLAAC
eukprot:14571464-Alexandrium_andersonii.AAC.1